MRPVLLIAVLVGLGLSGCRQAKLRAMTASAQSFTPLRVVSDKKPDFATEIEPIFRNRCQPCHFQGGKVYDRLPFDRPETIIMLGEKLFTRIKDEKEQRLVREFLAAQ